MMDFIQFELAITPAINRTETVTILIDEANMLYHMQIMVLGFKNHLMLINLANLTIYRDAGNNILTSQHLVAAQISISATPGTILGFDLKKVKRFLRPPAQSIGRFTMAGFTVHFHPHHHIESQDLIINEKVQASRTP